MKKGMTDADNLRAWHTIMEDKNAYHRDAALSEIIMGNDGFILTLIQRSYSPFMMTCLEDMMQEGRMAILENLKKYNPEKGKFTTFISFYIQHHISGYLCKIYGSTPHYMSNVKKYKNALAVLAKEGIEEPSIEEIAEKMGVGRDAAMKAHNMYVRQMGAVSLDDDANFTQVSDMVGNVTDTIEANETKAALYEAVSRLDADEKDVIMELYLSGSDNTKALRAVAEKLGIQIDDVRRIRATAYKKLRNDKALAGQVPDNLQSEFAQIDSITISFGPSNESMCDDVDAILNMDGNDENAVLNFDF